MHEEELRAALEAARRAQAARADRRSDCRGDRRSDLAGSSAVADGLDASAVGADGIGTASVLGTGGFDENQRVGTDGSDENQRVGNDGFDENQCVDADGLGDVEPASSGGLEDFHTPGGIGTLAEKTLHAALKFYYEPHSSCHEIPVGGYVADILGEDGIIEIQTRGFGRLREKLAAFLPACRVTVVYPLPWKKRLCWLDGTTGEVLSRRRSPKVASVYEAFGELMRMVPMLTAPGLTIRILPLEIEEIRVRNPQKGRRPRRLRKDWVLEDRIPLSAGEEVVLECPADYIQFVPVELSDGFTVKAFAKAAAIPERLASITVSVLYRIGVLRRCGKEGNAYRYAVVEGGDGLDAR